MDPFPVVAQHVVFGVRLDRFAELIGMPLDFSKQAFCFGLDIEIGENANRKKNRQHDTEGQFVANFAIKHESPF